MIEFELISSQRCRHDAGYLLVSLDPTETLVKLIPEYNYVIIPTYGLNLIQHRCHQLMFLISKCIEQIFKRSSQFNITLMIVSIIATIPHNNLVGS